MPKGVTKKNNNVDPKSRAISPDNQDKSATRIEDEKEIIGSSGIGKTDIQSSKQQQDLTQNNDHLINEGDILMSNEIEKEKLPSAINPNSDLNFFIEDVRDSIKERTLSDSSSQILPGSDLKKTRIPKFFQKIDNWMYGKVKIPFSPYKHVIGSSKRKRSPIRIIILIVLLVCLGYVLVIAGKMLTQITPVVVPTNTPVPTYSIPVPYSIKFPGGWTFVLGTSTTSYQKWTPVQAEWFKDTTICKLIAIPWTKQIDAVYKTLEPGEELILTMSNEDEAIYQIETLETSLVENIINKLNRNSPCMIIFLYREHTLTAQVLISTPPIP